MKAAFSHRSVLLNEVMQYLVTDKSGIYIDATFGRGGHARALLEQLNRDGKLFAIDRDLEAVKTVASDLQKDSRLTLVHGFFADLEKFCQQWQVMGKVTGLLLDLGVSSPQLDDASRGFSFTKEGPLDMRMDTTQGMSAAEWLAIAKETNIAEVLKDYGEEKFAKRIAHAIVNQRKITPLKTTLQLAELIKVAKPRWEKNIHPATRSFQAIRIFINEELKQLKRVLQQALAVLAIGGRIAVISFHSLEDRIVKRFFRDQARGRVNDFVAYTEQTLTLRLISKAIKPSEEEIENNPRARSAILRVAEKIS